MESVIKVIVGFKVVGLMLFVILLVVSFAYTLVVGPADSETTHGHTAVCKDGTVLEPPWNICGEEHGYLDHWTTGTAATPTERVVQEPSFSSGIPPDVIDDLMDMPTPDACVEADAQGEIPRDRYTPCGQILGYFDDRATPPPGAPAVVTSAQ